LLCNWTNTIFRFWIKKIKLILYLGLRGHNNFDCQPNHDLNSVKISKGFAKLNVFEAEENEAGDVRSTEMRSAIVPVAMRLYHERPNYWQTCPCGM